LIAEGCFKAPAENETCCTVEARALEVSEGVHDDGSFNQRQLVDVIN
jgi:hypothetical protein